MAGSWKHVVEDDGTFISSENFPNMIENLGDAYEALEECYGMIVWLANGDEARIQDAHEHWKQGLDFGIVGDS